MRRMLTAAAAGTVLLAPHASASPAASAESAAAVNFRLGGHSIALEVGQEQSGALRLRMDVASGNGDYTAYGATLPAGAFTISSTSATLRTTFAGQRVEMTWKVDNAVVVDTGVEQGRETDTSGWHAAGKGARVTVRIGGTLCKDGSGFGLLGNAVAHDGGSYGAPLATFPRQSAKGCSVS